MAFDRNDPVQLAELKDEMNTDPLGIGSVSYTHLTLPTSDLV